MKVIWDFFSGAGGFSLGFASKNNHLIGFDLDEIALQTYKYNLSKVSSKVTIVKCDISRLSFIRLEGKIAVLKYNLELLEVIGECYFWKYVIIKIPKPDILIGSPPCQRFSLQSLGKNCRTQDMSFIEKFNYFEKKLKPNYWVMENVIGCMLPNSKILYANWFHLYHKRPRKFWSNFKLPGKKTNNKIKHPTIMASEIKIGIIRNGNQKRWSSCGNKFKRILHPFEYKVLMGFPGNYKFFGSKTQQIRQIGNSVCPTISKEIYNSIIKNKPFPKQENLMKFLRKRKNKKKLMNSTQTTTTRII